MNTKKVMFDRVVYLNERDFLKASSELIEEFESIKKTSADFDAPWT